VRIVIALGGNALLTHGQRPEAEPQRVRVLQAARAIADAAQGHDLVIVHGNGPQVGMLALESRADPALRTPYPLADLTAETQGLIGHWIAAGFRAAEPARTAVALVSHAVVDATDPALAHPTKPIGPVVTAAEADAAHRRWGWRFRPHGDGMRRVVASPEPRAVIELPAAELLLRAGAVVVIGGGGGIAVTANGREVDAIIDKDLVAAQVASALHADRLVILTDVPAVVDGYGTPHARPLAGPHSSAELAEMSFEAGSMGPKVLAARRFVDQTAGVASIGALGDVEAIMAGEAGTHVLPSVGPASIEESRAKQLAEA
jgi:carbamate kinase